MISRTPCAVELPSLGHALTLAWTGNNEVRFYTVEGNILTITAIPNKSPVDGREGRSIAVLEKVKAPTQ